MKLSAVGFLYNYKIKNVMKKVCLVCVLLTLALWSVQAQNREIRFEKSRVWNEILEKAKKEIREKDAEIDRQSKIAGVFCKAYEKAVLLTPTEENVRIWVKCTRMTKEEMEDTIQESRELAGVFTSIAGLMEHLLPERGTL